jgi:DNA-binding response OmpR family regulator
MPARILVVDDDAELRNEIAATLREAGHVVDAVDTAATALQSLSSGHYDLLVTDVIMPGQDGLALIRAIPAAHRPRVLAISGGSTRLPAAFTLGASGALGADGTLLKPFRAQELLDAVAALLAPRG